MRSRQPVLAMIVVLSLLTAGCLKDVVRELAKDITQTKALQSDLSKRFHDDVFVSVNQADGRVALNVTFVNSPLNDKSREERATRAQETANVVRFHYPDIESLSAIWVVFMRERKSLVFIREREAVDYYGFDKTAARTSTSYSRTTNSEGVELRTTTNYIASDNETDISVSGIQLAGTPGGNGLTMLPHFRAKGDVRAAKSPPPKVVTFDFASYSDIEQFEPNMPVVFIGDGRTLLKTTANFNVSRLSGSVNEFLYLPVPYPAFRSMVGSSQVKIKLGAKEFPLNAQQLAVMRDMCDYLTE